MTETSLENAADLAQRKKNIRLTVVVLVAFMALVLGLFINKLMTPRILSPKEMVNNGAIMFSTPREIAPLKLIDEQGNAFDKEQLKGQWTLVFFGFTHCPDICPTTLTVFNRLSETLLDSPFAEDTQFLLVTLDPARDTPEKLAEHVGFFGSDIRAVTGEFLDIHRFAKGVNIAFQKIVEDDGDYTVDHSGNIVLINPQGHYHGFFKPPIKHDQLSLTYKSVRMSNR